MKNVPAFHKQKVKKEKTSEKCPLGGDVTNNCFGCAYSGEYIYDKESGECVPIPELPVLDSSKKA